MARGLNRDHAFIMRKYKVIKMHVQNNEEALLPTAKYGSNCSRFVAGGMKITV
jgi:hypothetical protein